MRDQVLNAGDDRSRPDRVSRTVAAWLASGRTLDALHGDAQMLDAGGARLHVARPHPDMRRAPHPRVIAGDYHHAIGATLAWTKRLQQRFGPMDHASIEDHVIPFRAALAGGIGYIDAVLIDKAPGGVANLAGPMSGRERLFGTRLRDLRWMIADFTQMAADLGKVGHEDAKALGKTLGNQQILAMRELALAQASPGRRLLMVPAMILRAMLKRDRRYARAGLVYAAPRLSEALFDRRYRRRKT